MTNALGHDFVGFSVLVRHNIRPPHFASKVSYSASPQSFVAPYYLAKNADFFCNKRKKIRGLSNTYLILFTYLCNISLTYIKIHIKIIIMAGNVHQTIAHRI